MGELHVSDLVGHFSQVVNACHGQAFADARAQDFQRSLSGIPAPAKACLMLATTGEEKFLVGRSINSPKRQFFGSVLRKGLCKICTPWPRDDKTKKQKGSRPLPLIVGGSPKIKFGCLEIGV